MISDQKSRQLEARVEKLKPVHKTCSQVSFAVLNEQFKLNADQVIPALMLFAGGIAGKGETCGAVTGSLLAMGFYFQPLNQTGSSGEYGGLFFNRFMTEFGSTRCREIVRHQYGRYYDFNNPEEKKVFAEVSQKSGKCMDVVKTAVLIAGDIILDTLQTTGKHHEISKI